MVGDLTAEAGTGLLVSLGRGSSLGSGSARLDLSQKGDLPSSGERQFSFGPRSPARAKGATASSIFKIIYKDKQGDDLEEMTK